jgi:hypothetical protein
MYEIEQQIKKIGEKKRVFFVCDSQKAKVRKEKKRNEKISSLKKTYRKSFILIRTIDPG